MISARLALVGGPIGSELFKLDAAQAVVKLKQSAAYKRTIRVTNFIIDDVSFTLTKKSDKYFNYVDNNEKEIFVCGKAEQFYLNAADNSINIGFDINESNFKMTVEKSARNTPLYIHVLITNPANVVIFEQHASLNKTMSKTFRKVGKTSIVNIWLTDEKQEIPFDCLINCRSNDYKKGQMCSECNPWP